MKALVCIIAIWLSAAWTSQLCAQPKIYNSFEELEEAWENGSAQLQYIDVNTLFYYGNGDFRTSDDCVIVYMANLFIAAWTGKIAMKKGEVLLMQEYYPFFSLENQDAVRRFSGSDNVKLDTLDKHTTVNKMEEDEDFVIYDMFMSNGKYNFDNLPDEYAKYSFVLHKYGVLSNFTLVPIKNQSQSISDWIKAQAFTPETSEAEIMWHLTNDLECQATDTYGQEIDLISTYNSWKLDMEEGTATFTPYFTPRQFKTTWQSGEPFELSLGTNKAAHIGTENAYHDADGKLVLRLWSIGGGTVTDIATINANATAQDVWYDMFGRKYITKPTAAGLYIHNGKKEVVK